MNSATQNAHPRRDVFATLTTVIPYFASAVAAAVAADRDLGDLGVIVHFGFEMELLVAFDFDFYFGFCSGFCLDFGFDPDPDPDALL